MTIPLLLQCVRSATIWSRTCSDCHCLGLHSYVEPSSLHRLQCVSGLPPHPTLAHAERYGYHSTHAIPDECSDSTANRPRLQQRVKLIATHGHSHTIRHRQNFCAITGVAADAVLTCLPRRTPIQRHRPGAKPRADHCRQCRRCDTQLVLAEGAPQQEDAPPPDCVPCGNCCRRNDLQTSTPPVWEPVNSRHQRTQQCFPSKAAGRGFDRACGRGPRRTVKAVMRTAQCAVVDD